MAGIGFRINRLAASGGVGGGLAAAGLGVAISSGPWLCTALGAAGLRAMVVDRLDATAMMHLQAVLVYAFSVSAMAASCVTLVATRLVSDALFARDPERVPSLLLGALTTVTLVALIGGGVVFGLLSALPAGAAVCALCATVLLSQLWILSLFLSAVRRFVWVMTAYVLGIGAAAPVAWLASQTGSLTLAAATLTTSAGVTVVALLYAVRRDFPPAGDVPWPQHWWGGFRNHYHILLAGILSTAAIWIDKWVMWFMPGSVTASGGLRLHPLYDSASYFGLLSLVPGVALILVVVETRFDRAFATLIAYCTGRAVMSRIEGARRDVVSAVLSGGRILLISQGALAFLLWVMAPAILDAMGADPRGIVTFRFVQAGNLCYLLTLYAVMILHYFDLAGRALTVWAGFALVSLVGSLVTGGMGFQTMGWGYFAGAATGAVIGWTCVFFATRDLVYLLFVGNNPTIRGDMRRWA